MFCGWWRHFHNAKRGLIPQRTILVGRNACAIAKGMCQNTSLEKLTIFNFSLGDEFVVEEFAYMLKHNKTLKELLISHDEGIFIGNADTWTQCYVILSNSLRFNKTLTSLIFHPPPFPEGIEEFYHTECARDSRLTLR